MITVRDLRVDYDDVCAVNDLNLEIGPSEIYGLIGPNGAGKTTTLGALIGLLEPTYGEILLNGLDISTHREAAIRWVGFMPDSTPIYPDLTVWEYLDMFAASYFIPATERKAVIDKYLALVDLTEKRDAMTEGLSRGMLQRLLLAKTLLPEPKIVLLDEPASGLDPFGRALLKNIVRELGAQGKTVMISSHILSDLSEFCTAIGVMERGRLVISGSVDEVAQLVLGQSVVRIEVLDDPALCVQTLEAHAGVGAIRQDDHVVTCTVDGGPEEDSALLAALLAAGVRVVAFGRQKADLEEVFLKIGAREVS